MSKYQEIKQRIAQLEKEAEQARKQEMQDAMAKIGEIMKTYDISMQDLSKAFGGSGKKNPPKYRDPITGKTWSGKGRMPNWYDPNREAEFLIG